MCPMYKVTPNRSGNVRWTKVDTTYNTKRMQAIAWLNTEEGKLFIQQVFAKQMSETLENTERKNFQSQQKSSPLSSSTDNQSSSHKSYPLPNQNTSTPSHSRSANKMEYINNSKQKIESNSSSEIRFSNSIHSQGSTSKVERRDNTEISLSPARSSRLVRNPRLLDENASLFPRPVKSASNTDMIASILEKSLIERQRLESR